MNRPPRFSIEKHLARSVCFTCPEAHPVTAFKVQLTAGCFSYLRHIGRLSLAKFFEVRFPVISF